MNKLLVFLIVVGFVTEVRKGVADGISWDFNVPETSILEVSGTQADRLISPEGNHSIWYEAGTSTDRKAWIYKDTLRMSLYNAAIGGTKGRAQLQLSDLSATQLVQDVSVYFPSGLSAYQSYPSSNGWFTLAEYFMGALGTENRFRVTLSLVKSTASELYFRVSGDIRTGGTAGNGIWQEVWSDVYDNAPISLGNWLTLTFGLQTGDDSSGKFILDATDPITSATVRLFDITNWTYHPSATSPIPVTSYNPLKLYTSKSIIDWINSQGEVTEIVFDNLTVQGF